jgi:multicomponent Na+:H+ antiporter subunit B
MKHSLILKLVAKFLIPVIALFALYVQFHGDYGPGGGFQAGVIFSAAFILYAIIFGLETAEQVITPRLLRVLTSLGVMIYASTGFATLMLGGRFLDYSVLADRPVEGQHLGILLIELGVGITVSAVMLTIFFAFAGRERP